jgi:hypothetical protein
MTSSTSIPPLTEQVRTALATFTTAHADAENKIAAAATLKLTVGSNEADRKRQAASMSAEEYSGYVLHLTEAEKEKAAAVALLERTEKELNVLRELLQHETANVSRAWAEIADRTAIKYAELQMQPPARVIMHTTHNPDDLPF